MSIIWFIYVNRVLKLELAWIHFKRVVIGIGIVRTKKLVASNKQKDFSKLKEPNPNGGRYKSMSDQSKSKTNWSLLIARLSLVQRKLLKDHLKSYIRQFLVLIMKWDTHTFSLTRPYKSYIIHYTCYKLDNEFKQQKIVLNQQKWQNMNDIQINISAEYKIQDTLK